MQRQPTLIALAASLLVAGTAPALAQTKADFDALRDEIRQLREELNAMKRGQAAAPKPSFKGIDITGAEYARDFDLPDVEVAAMTGREVHLMVRGDINPLLARIATHRVVDIAITTPDVEDIFLRHYRDDAPEEVPA